MSLFIYTLRNIAGAIVTPPLVFLLVALGTTLYLKNKRIVTMQKIILGGSVNSTIELTLSQLVLGIIGGCVGSLILTSLGVVFNESSGIVYLLILSILLMFIKPRLICFAYSGAILGFISIIIKGMGQFYEQFWNNGFLVVDILYLGVFIGVFHIVEGILVMFDGDRGAVPVFTSKSGKIWGGYALKRYWVLPISIMIALASNNPAIDYSTSLIQNPEWWPLIKTTSGLSLITSGIISILPFYTVLGYSSITFTRTKREKAISSGLYILFYGIVLIMVSQIARFGIIGEMLVIILMPFGHEFMLRIQAEDEEKRTPKFVSDEEGLIILEISSDSKVREFNVGIEDKLVSVNGKDVNSEAEVYSILKESLYNTVLEIKNFEGKLKKVEFRHSNNTRLGVLVVPRNVNEEDVIPVDDNNFKSVLSSIIDSDNNECKKNKVDKDR
ncbi:signal protein PDZ [Clostridium chromiireducens]|uniref:signal protein PDZ n=1 Tax=Clostridium chromiireducens TaxID=225345 RepID=UPI003AF7FB6F